MVTLVNRAKMTTATTGTGTITLGSAEAGYQSFADAGVVDADVVRYVIEDGAAWEIGTGTYTTSGTTLTRSVDESSNADAALNLTGSAVVFVSAVVGDFVQPGDTLSDGFASVLDNDGTVSSGTYTPAVSGGNYKGVTNGGAFTLSPPTLANDTATDIKLLIVNSATAGAVTLTGWTHITGDFTTTSGHSFWAHIQLARLGAVQTSTINIEAHQ